MRRTVVLVLAVLTLAACNATQRPIPAEEFAPELPNNAITLCQAALDNYPDHGDNDRSLVDCQTADEWASVAAEYGANKNHALVHLDLICGDPNYWETPVCLDLES